MSGMRMITKSGKYNLPFEVMVVFVRDRYVCAKYPGEMSAFELGDYTSPEEAMRAFDNLNKHYEDYVCNLNCMPFKFKESYPAE